MACSHRQKGRLSSMKARGWNAGTTRSDKATSVDQRCPLCTSHASRLPPQTAEPIQDRRGYGAVRCGAMRCDAVRCDAMRCDAMRCEAVQCIANPTTTWAASSGKRARLAVGISIVTNPHPHPPVCNCAILELVCLLACLLWGEGKRAPAARDEHAFQTSGCTEFISDRVCGRLTTIVPVLRCCLLDFLGRKDGWMDGWAPFGSLVCSRCR